LSMYLEAEAIENIDGRNLFFKFTCQSFAPVCMGAKLGRLEPRTHGILDTQGSEN
jgi:hypothetical protein